MLEINSIGPLVAMYEGWKIYQNNMDPTDFIRDKFVAINDGIMELGDSIDEVVEQIASRVGELSRKEGAWSAGICENH